MLLYHRPNSPLFPVPQEKLQNLLSEHIQLYVFLWWGCQLLLPPDSGSGAVWPYLWTRSPVFPYHGRHQEAVFARDRKWHNVITMRPTECVAGSYCITRRYRRSLSHLEWQFGWPPAGTGKKIAATCCGLLTVVVENMVLTESEYFSVLYLKTKEKNYLVVKIRWLSLRSLFFVMY